MNVGVENLIHLTKKRFAFSLIISLFILINSTIISLAANGDGSGNGGNQGEPLTLASASITDGQNNVPLKPQIKLVFSKNVVNMTIRDANKKCFSLLNDKGNNISIQVEMADDQIDFEKRDDVLITPTKNLLPGSRYIIKIAPDLQSKSGVKLGKEIRISFKTLGTAPTAGQTKATTNTNKSNLKTANKNIVSSKSPASIKKSVNVNNSIPKVVKEEKANINGNNLENKGSSINSLEQQNNLGKSEDGINTAEESKSTHKKDVSKFNKRVIEVSLSIAILIVLLFTAIYFKFKKVTS